MYWLLVLYLISTVVLFFAQMFDTHRSNESFSMSVFVSVFYPLIILYAGLTAILVALCVGVVATARYIKRIFYKIKRSFRK